MSAVASDRFECVGGGPGDGSRRDCYGRASLYVRAGAGVHHYTLGGFPKAWQYVGRIGDAETVPLDPHQIVPLNALG